MAGISTKDLKARIRSMESTRQITKAMEMVAASKLRGAQEKAISSRPYFEVLYSTMLDLADSRPDHLSPFCRQGEGKKVCCIAIAGDRGLAGGYNSGVLKLVWEKLQGRDFCVLPLGKKSVDFFRSKGARMLTTQYAEVSDVSVSDCFSMARLLAKEFLAGTYDELILGYTNFVSVLTQSPATVRLLPLPEPEEPTGRIRDVTYEPDAATVYDTIVPEYLGGLIYGAVCESVASEQAARRTAMDAATKNADEMIEGLSLQYNRARQGAITQEITEIVAGAEA